MLRSNNPADVQTYFDLLPKDVLVRLCAHVCHNYPTFEACALAKVSGTLREAVIHALSNCVVIDVNNLRYLSQIHEAFSGHVEEINLRTPGTVSHARTKSSRVKATVLYLFRPHILQVLTSTEIPRLLYGRGVRSVSIPAREQFLVPLAMAPSVRRVEILIGEMSTHTKQLLFRAFNSLSLVSVSIICNANRSCICREPTPLMFGGSCETLENVDISCRFCTQRRNSSGVWPMLLHFFELRGFGISLYKPELEQIPGPIMKIVKRLEEFRVESIRFSETFFSHFAEQLTKLDVHEALQQSQLITLLNCTRIRDLRLNVRPGCEETLISLVKQQRDLVKLSVCFIPVSTLLFNPDTHNKVRHYESSGTLIQLTENAPGLRELHIGDMRVSPKELAVVLKQLGLSLRKLQIPIGGQEESVEVWMGELLRAICLYNGELRVLEQSDSHVHPGVVYIRGDEDENVNSTWLIGRAEMSCPYLDVERLREIHDGFAALK